MTPSATPPSPAPSGDNRNLVAVGESYAAPSFEERLHSFWRTNSKIMTAALVVVLLAIVINGAFDYLAKQKERDIEQAYAAAGTSAQVKAFAAANSQHPLGGVASVRVADEAYTESRYADAITAYDQAASILKTGPLASRARLGSAVAKLQAGRAADAETALKALAVDLKEIKAYRAEASYQLASLAAAKGNAAEVKTYSDQLMQLDPASPWTQRSLALLVLASPVETTPSPAGPQISVPGSGK